MYSFMLFLMKVDSSVCVKVSYEMDDRGIGSTPLQSVRIAVGQLSYLSVNLASCKR